MSKADFEFYSLGGDLPEFVVPKPENDFYHGVFVPSANALALNGVHEVVRNSVGDTPFNVGYIEGDIDDSFKFRLPREGFLPPIQSKTYVFVEPSKESFEDLGVAQDMVTEWVSGMYREFMRPEPLVSKDDIEGLFSEEQAATLEARLTPRRGLVNEYEYITDAHDEPCDASVSYCDTLPIRTYTWSPGPERSGGLPAVYNPQRFGFNLLLASSVRVIIKNPLKESQPKPKPATV